MKQVFWATLCLMIAVWVSPLYAGEAGNNYMTFKAGIYSPQASKIDHFDEGFHGEIAFGYKYNPNFAAEMAVGYYHTDGTYKVGSGSERQQVKYNIDVYPLTLTLKGGIPIEDFEFYGLAGIGAHIVRGKFDDTVFGAHLGAGVLYNLSRSCFIGVEGKYQWTGKAELKDAKPGEDLLGKVELDGILATAVVGFRF